MLKEHILYGMKLWALQLVPSLFPFMILTKCFLWYQEHSHHKDTHSPFGNLCCKLWNLSCDNLLLLFLGILCGYPVGAKIISEQYSAHKITRKEAEYLLTICNQASPAFILTYFISYALNLEQYTLQILILLYSSTFFTSLITRRIYPSSYRKEPLSYQKPAAHTPFFQYLDDCILTSASVCIKIGGYMILFCALTALCLKLLNHFTPFQIWFCSSFELTYGLFLLKKLQFSNPLLKHLSLFACFSFGGICTMAQIKGMLVQTSLSLKPYMIGKCIYTMILLILYSIFYLCIKIV